MPHQPPLETPSSSRRLEAAWASRDGETEARSRSRYETGVGIALEDLPKVFEEFSRSVHLGAHTQGHRAGAHTLAKRFIELHGGRIWVDGEVGRGTTFTFRIPAMAAVAG